MQKDSKIYIAGHRGTLGMALLNALREDGFKNILVRDRSELDLTNQSAVEEFFQAQKPEYVFLCAAKLDTLGVFTPAQVIYENSMLQANIIHCAYKHGAKKLVFYGSAWAYPQRATNPIREEDLLGGKLDAKAMAYGLAKIIGTKMCESYNLQYGTHFLVLYLANLYGETAEFDLQKAKVLPALLRKFHLAKLLEDDNFEGVLEDLGTNQNEAKAILKNFGIAKDSVEIWGSGKVVREFIHAKDLARASIFVAQNVHSSDLQNSQEQHFNVGSGEFLSIKELAWLVREIVGFKGEIVFNVNKPDSTMNRMLDSAKLRSLGWKHTISLEQGITMMYTWYRTQQFQSPRRGGGHYLASSILTLYIKELNSSLNTLSLKPALHDTTPIRKSA